MTEISVIMIFGNFIYYCVKDCLIDIFLHFSNGRKEYKKAENNVDSVKFALAKNLVFFSDKRKHKIMGTQMLKELSERSLSSDLQLALDGSSQAEK